MAAKLASDLAREPHLRYSSPWKSKRRKQAVCLRVSEGLEGVAAQEHSISGCENKALFRPAPQPRLIIMSLFVGQPRILVVEDEIIVARDIEQQLVELGYQPLGHAPHGEEAIAMAEQLVPDLVLMDIQLNGALDGIAAAQAIRTLLKLPVVFLTAFVADDVIARAKLSDPFGYILKPFSDRELRTVIEMALFKHQAEMKLRDATEHTQAILDNMVDAVVTMNAQGAIQSFNAAAIRMFG